MSYTAYHQGKTGQTFYAKALPLDDSTWANGVVAGVETGSTGSFVFASLTDNVGYNVYLQAGASPASSDTPQASIDAADSVDLSTLETKAQADARQTLLITEHDATQTAVASSGVETSEIVAAILAVQDQIPSPANTNQIIRTEGDHWNISITQLGNISGRTNLVWVLKNDRSDRDSKAVLKITETLGLVTIHGSPAPDSADASITVNDEVTGDVTVIVRSSATKRIRSGLYADGLKKIETDADQTFRPLGELMVTEGPVD